MNKKNIQMIIKRIIDIVGSIIGIILLSPIFIIVSILIKLESRGPIFYIQERVGFKRKLFKIYKFRSMVDKAEFTGAGLYFDGDNDPRITKVGRFIRKTSIDELPQLFNVLKGEMSLVGPRPLLEYTTDKMSDCQRLRLIMRPGITGYAQISGRRDLNYKERIEKDLDYIENYSLLFDLKIIVKTIGVVLLRKGNKDDQTKSETEKF
ncbi:sugar transferase [[Clostridium] dakarense]|uniref:sugar transferase n=1 Tax=Faecalimicrobium dakarense TaxID=1301100 RepID=UPI0004BC2F63|nr:exopolysaccharide biosynthesis polyprenyl glycosylphosphotransferase [[Clostridium] dakarense]